MRNLPSNILPISTVMREQHWFAGTVKRVEELVVPQEIVSRLEAKHTMCQKNCVLSLPCNFMIEYLNYLRTLNFNQILSKINAMASKNPRVDSIVLMVYEKSSCKCAERPCLQQWFKENGIELKERIKSPLSKSTITTTLF